MGRDIPDVSSDPRSDHQHQHYHDPTATQQHRQHTNPSSDLSVQICHGLGTRIFKIEGEMKFTPPKIKKSENMSIGPNPEI